MHDGREHGWWEPLTDGVAPERFVMDDPGRYAALENDATSVRSFDVTFIHGLLQTDGLRTRGSHRPCCPTTVRRRSTAWSSCG